MLDFVVVFGLVLILSVLIAKLIAGDLLLDNDSLLYLFLCVQRLIYSLNSQWNVPTITHNLGYTALYSISAFETQVEEITSYICQKVIQVIELNHQ